MAWATDIKHRILKAAYSRGLWIFVLNGILIFVPIGGLTIIRSRDYRSLNHRSFATRDLSRSVQSLLSAGLSSEDESGLIEALPVIAPYQRIIVASGSTLEFGYDTGWRKNEAFLFFQYELPLVRMIADKLRVSPPPELNEDEIMKRLGKYIRSGADRFSIINYRFLYDIRSFRSPEGTAFSLVVLTDKGDLLESSRVNKILLLLITALSVLIALAVSLAYYRLMIRPLHILTREADRLSDPSVEPALLFSQKDRLDEVGALSSAFFRSSAELIRQRESLEVFTADVLHELKNPLTGIRNAIEILQSRMDDGEAERELLTLLSGEAGRIEKLLFDIREYSLIRKDECGERECAAKDVIKNVLSLYGRWEVGSRIRCDRPVRLSEKLFVSVLTNLLDNAIGFSPEPGSVFLSYEEEEGTAVLSVSDAGPGVPKEERERIFDRFYSSRERVGSRTELHSGLGLSIVKKILEEQGHSIRCEENSGGGAIFRVVFHGDILISD
jgi:signal transduction histidine kinase